VVEVVFEVDDLVELAVDNEVELVLLVVGSVVDWEVDDAEEPELVDDLVVVD